MDRADKKLRREAAFWFARLRGPDAHAHQLKFEAWRKSDPCRQAAYDRLVKRWDDAAVLKDSHFEKAADHSSLRRPQPTPWRVAALAVCSVLVAVTLAPVRPTWLNNWPIPSPWFDRISTQVGEIRTVQLSDGSSITLDTDTVVTTHFSASARRLSLSHGRARFEVAHDPGRPFTVAVGGGAVTARGTIFDISLSPDKKVAVTLVRGAVDVDPAPSAGLAAGDQDRSIRLAPGQQVGFGRNVSVSRVQPASPAGLLWPSGLLTFEAAPVSEALAEANRYSHRRITLADPSLAVLRVSGAFPVAAPRAFATSLAATFNLRLEEAPNGDFVLARR